MEVAEPIKVTAAPYPKRQAYKKQSGWVKVYFKVNEHGKAYDLRFGESCPGDAFKRTVAKTIPKWHFEPQYGEASKQELSYTMTFSFEK
nr:TonB family protein [Pleionea sp. CnH1-48]